MTRARRGGAPTQRQLRVGEEVRHALARILARHELRDPELVDANITVTEVRMSPDLKSATAFISRFGGGDAATLARACGRAAGYFRARLAQEVTLRLVPTISFQPDTSFDHAKRIDALLEAVKPPDDPGPESDQEPDGEPPEGAP
jgi:ribosome-binding factor A